jgi:hypothetical protein
VQLEAADVGADLLQSGRIRAAPLDGEVALLDHVLGEGDHGDPLTRAEAGEAAADRADGAGQVDQRLLNGYQVPIELDRELPLLVCTPQKFRRNTLSFDNVI